MRRLYHRGAFRERRAGARLVARDRRAHALVRLWPGAQIEAQELLGRFAPRVTRRAQSPAPLATTDSDEIWAGATSGAMGSALLCGTCGISYSTETILSIGRTAWYSRASQRRCGQGSSLNSAIN